MVQFSRHESSIRFRPEGALQTDWSRHVKKRVDK